MEDSVKCIKSIIDYEIENYLEKELVLSVTFNNNDIRYVSCYDKKHRIVVFDDSKKIDLSILIDMISSYDVIDPTAFVKEEKREKPKKKFSLYNIAHGKPGKKYSIEKFLKHYEGSKKKLNSITDKKIEINGYIYYADSQQEISTIKKLLYYNCIKALRGQAPGISYRYNSKNHTYYPDFFILTNTNKVVILEVKEIAQMNSKENLKKYNALKSYCKKYGFLYLMCDKKFRDFEKLDEKYVGGEVDKAIKNALEKKGCFNRDDFEKLIKDKEYKQKKKIRDYIGIFISSHSEVKMVGDLNYKIASFKIIYK